jgi:hypothetical protein
MIVLRENIRKKGFLKVELTNPDGVFTVAKAYLLMT